MTELRVDVSAATPVYEQIRAQVAGLVALGTLTPGERLPASRDLARDLGIAVGTVQRAYRELEAAGVVTSRRRVGTVVAGPEAGTAPAHRRDAADGRDGAHGTPTLLDDVRALVRRARAEGLTDGALLTLVRGAQVDPSPDRSHPPGVLRLEGDRGLVGPPPA
ncbi:GntR family transcriptional regulator [Cellulomonas sp. ES6]|uniref:GntR family transcriptional regulator n=1 Tax=Cellulomonas sp. ES6 TaxID=3039384 RepID=UPI0024B85EB7|nr:GntR family transcriptional regulator [Cellulomonas sp. ES6]WHP18468.1 GntR family transcriptional regulator [Cellulomonas sp. ES6]